MAKDNLKGLIKIRELSKEAGIPVSTIHYYIQEGLLSPATKTARNMAYYNSSAVQEIRLIQELKSKSYLPLSVIKLILNSKREGQNINHILEMQSIMNQIFQPVEPNTQLQDIPYSEFLAVSGLSASTLKDLEDIGLIVPVTNESGQSSYDDLDIRISRLYNKLAELGLKPRDLIVYRQYIEIIHEEAKTMHETLHRLPDHDQISLSEMFSTLKEIKELLITRIYRQEMEHPHKHDISQK